MSVADAQRALSGKRKEKEDGMSNEMSNEVELPVRVVARLDEVTLTTRLVGIVYKPASGAVVREVTLAVVGDGACVPPAMGAADDRPEGIGTDEGVTYPERDEG